MILLINGFSLLCISNFVYPQENYPQRIISLGPFVTEQLYLLGVEERLVANTVYCKRPPDAQKKEKIGTVVKVDLEKIVSLNPDLILVTSLTNLKTVEKLKNLGMRVINFQYAKNFTEICEQFLKLGKAVSKGKEAKEIVDIAKKKVSLIKKRTDKLPKPKVFIQIGAKPLFTATRNSFVHDFIELAGGINIAAPLKSGLYNREKVIISNPDVIIIATMGIAGEEEKKIWQKYKTIKAVKSNRIYVVDSYNLCSPTPVTFVETLAEMVKILHPERGKIGE